MDEFETEDPQGVLREPDMQRLAEELVTSAQARGVELTGEDGLLTARTKTLAAPVSIALVASALVGCGSTPRFELGYTNDCTFAVKIAVVVPSQGSAHDVTIWPGERRKYVVFSDNPSEEIQLIVSAANGDPNVLNSRKFVLSERDVEHAPDPSKPFESVIDGELCEGLDPGASASAGASER